MTNEDEAFRKAIEKKNRDRKKPFLDALSYARSVCFTDSGRRFIASLQKQLSEKGFLTEKQVAALYEIDEIVKREYGYAGQDYDQDEFNLWDECDFGDFPD